MLMQVSLKSTIIYDEQMWWKNNNLCR